MKPTILNMTDNKEMLLQFVKYISRLKKNLLLTSMFCLLDRSTKIEYGTIKNLKRHLQLQEGLKVSEDMDRRLLEGN